jgi:hypothetical protein
MEAIRSSETSVLIRATRRHLPEDDNHHSHRRGNLKSYKAVHNFLIQSLFLSVFKFGKYLWKTHVIRKYDAIWPFLIYVESEISFIVIKSFRHVNISVRPHLETSDYGESFLWNTLSSLFGIKMLVLSPEGTESIYLLSRAYLPNMKRNTFNPYHKNGQKNPVSYYEETCEVITKFCNSFSTFSRKSSYLSRI